MHVADYEFGGFDTAGTAVDMRRLEAPLSPVITAELEGAVEYLGVDAEVLLIAALRGHPELEQMRVLQKGNRLSITPVDAEHWRFILALADGKA